MEKILKALLISVGLVAFVTGLNVIIGGTGAVPGATEVASIVHDNEMRFFAVFWVGYGAFSIWVTRDFSSRSGFVPVIAVLFFCGGIARVVSILSVGMPALPLVGATVLELLLPPIIMFLYYKKGS